MIQPIQIRFHHVRPDPEIIELIHRFAGKLDRVYPRITSCYVSIARPHRRHAAGNHYHVRIDLDVPGASLVATREPVINALLQEPGRSALRKGVDVAPDRKVLRFALHDAFDALTRQLREHAKRRRGDVKVHIPRTTLPVVVPALLRRALV